MKGFRLDLSDSEMRDLTALKVNAAQLEVSLTGYHVKWCEHVNRFIPSGGW